jgi:dephospho-CoA kinase
MTRGGLTFVSRNETGVLQYLMKLLGLTGGIGMGKSTAAQFLRRHGAQVVDTDELARGLVEPGQPALAEIQTVFGRNIISHDGHLRREALAQIVFADPAARRQLENILHPRIRESWLAQIESWRGQNQPLAVVVIPLLFETQSESHFNKTACVACSPASQHQRLLERGWTPEQIQHRIAAQWPVARKMARADFVVWTDGSPEAHAGQIERIVARW